MNVREAYHAVRGLQGLAATERKTWSVGPQRVRRRLWLWRRGFLGRADALYDPDEETYRDYVTDYQRFVRTKRINGTWSVALSNKLLFHWFLHSFDDQRMAVYGMIRDGSFHPIDVLAPSGQFGDGDPGGPGPIVVGPRGGSTASTAVNRGATSESDVRESGPNAPAPESGSAVSRSNASNAAKWVVDRLRDEGKLVLKWTRGGGGNNVLLCSRADDGYRVNGETHSEGAFRSLVASLEEYLVCEFVEQGSFSADLHPETPNTVRIVTMYDEATGEPFVAAAIYRIGTADSAPMDNFSQGGLSAKIDLETGELGPGARPPTDGGGLEWHATHPDTGALIDGVSVPDWDGIRDRILEIADSRSFVPYVGWDVVVTGDGGEFTVIEANSYPGLKSIQVHGPLLTDDRVRRFYEHHGVR